MGNGFPIGGILIHPSIKAKHGMLGTTFGGNHLACAAGIAVLEIMEKEALIDQVNEISSYFREQAAELPQLTAIKGRGLMLGLEFPFEIADYAKDLSLITTYLLVVPIIKSCSNSASFNITKITCGHLHSSLEGYSKKYIAL